MNDDVVFSDGARGSLVAAPVPGDADGMAEVLLDSGQTLLVPVDVLVMHAEGDYRVAVDSRSFAGGITNSEDAQVISLVEETLTVGKREVETGRVHFSKTVTERVETVDEPLFKTVVEVKRVGVSRFVDAAPEVRYEQDVMIIPIMEEVLVVEKRLRIKEEVYVSQKREEYHKPQQVTLRTETLSEERIPAAQVSNVL